jgi:nucleoside-diphosphate-sugar epimerase
MDILVTGGAGYIGSVLVGRLLSEGHSVRVVDLLRRGGQGLLGYCANPAFDFILGDICDPAVAARATDGIDAIVHLAALVGYPACRREPGFAKLTNVFATQTVLTARRPGQKLIFASTGSVYGAVNGGICTEDTEPRPVSLYGETKAESEHYVLTAGDSVCLRFATAYGVSPCMRDDLLVHTFVRDAVHTSALVVYEPDALRSFVHVNDIAGSILFLLNEWKNVRNQIYNVGDQSLCLTKRQLCERILSHLRFELRFAEFAKDQDRRDYWVSFESLRKKGFHAIASFDDSLRELAMAYRLRPPASTW